MTKVYFLTGIVIVSIATLIYQREKGYRRTAPARKVPRASKSEDMNRNRLGDPSGYDRISSVSLI